MYIASAKTIYKIFAVYLLFCFAKASGGTCLSYGHSCWGGHGKRNGASHSIEPSVQKRVNDWYLSKLFNSDVDNPKEIATLLKNQNQDTEDMDKFRQFQYKLFPLLDADNAPRNDPGELEGDGKTAKWRPDTNDSEEELVVLTPDVERVPMSKYRLFQLMKQENSKKRGANK